MSRDAARQLLDRHTSHAILAARHTTVNLRHADSGANSRSYMMMRANVRRLVTARRSHRAEICHGTH
jgi:hypothetical protein